MLKKVNPRMTRHNILIRRLGKVTHRVWTILRHTVHKFSQIDGAKWAGSFAFHAFFSLFPLMILFVSIASFFVEKERAVTEVLAYTDIYIPINGEMHHYIFDTIAGVIDARKQASVFAFFILVWVALRCYTTLISATNRAWGTAVHNWWQLPLKSLMLLSIMAGAVLLGMVVPVLMRMAKGWLFPEHAFRSWVYGLGSFFIPLLVLFLGLSLFYKFAPRRHTRFTEVWTAALITTVLLQAGESLFVIYLKDFATLNAVYGAFGGMMALLLWIYISGCIFVFGACLCAVQAGLTVDSDDDRARIDTRLAHVRETFDTEPVAREKTRQTDHGYGSKYER